MDRCQFCGKKGGEYFEIDGERFRFHVGMLFDCLHDYLIGKALEALDKNADHVVPTIRRLPKEGSKDYE